MSASLVVTPLGPGPGSGPALVRRNPVGDARGSFARLFCRDELAAFGWTGPVAQVNYSRTLKAGTIRGFHYQRAPHAEMKLVTCLRGAVHDVAVDIRPDSPRRHDHVVAELSAENGCAMLIPEGFAHGFQAFTDDVELLYLHSVPYAPSAAAGLRPDDPALAIEWPLGISLLSDRDASWPLLRAEEV